jgi:phage baseplate assembly protein W
MNVAYPLAIDTSGRTATCDDDAHVEQMIEQLLFTAPGERAMRPTFGCGLRQLLFEPNSDVLAATTQLVVNGALQQWLGTVIDVLSVEVLAEDSTLRVTVSYQIRRTGAHKTSTFEKTA